MSLIEHWVPVTPQLDVEWTIAKSGGMALRSATHWPAPILQLVCEYMQTRLFVVRVCLDLWQGYRTVTHLPREMPALLHRPTLQVDCREYESTLGDVLDRLLAYVEYQDATVIKNKERYWWNYSLFGEQDGQVYVPSWKRPPRSAHFPWTFSLAMSLDKTIEPSPSNSTASEWKWTQLSGSSQLVSPEWSCGWLCVHLDPTHKLTNKYRKYIRRPPSLSPYPIL